MDKRERICNWKISKKIKSETDVKKFNSTTEKDILEQSLADPDTPILTKKELKEMKPAKERKNGKRIVKYKKAP